MHIERLVAGLVLAGARFDSGDFVGVGDAGVFPGIHDGGKWLIDSHLFKATTIPVSQAIGAVVVRPGCAFVSEQVPLRVK